MPLSGPAYYALRIFISSGDPVKKTAGKEKDRNNSISGFVTKQRRL